MDQRSPFHGHDSLAQSVFDSIPDPLVVLNPQFRIIAASRSFRSTFGITEQSNGECLFDLLEGKWDFPELRRLLDLVIARDSGTAHEAIEYEPVRGAGATLFGAKRIASQAQSESIILLSVTDITERRSVERDREAMLEHAEELLRQQSIMLREMEHRVANSLQIIASILLLKAKTVSSEETRLHLQDAHKRVMSVAQIQKHLHPSGEIDQIEVSSYLEKLCAGLAESMIKDDATTSVKVIADRGVVGSSAAVSLGLIVTELVINAIKHAFPDERSDALILITYERADTDWKLVVSDNGVGRSGTPEPGLGLGTTIIEALAKQLDAVVATTSTGEGYSVSLTRSTFTSRMPKAH